MPFTRRMWLVVLLACTSNIAPMSPDLLASQASETLALVGVNVIPVDGDGLEVDQTVVVRDGRVAAIGPANITSVPAGARVIEGRGRYLVPGLYDMHVHIRTADLPAYLRNGVTTVRNMWGYTSLTTTQRSIAAGTLAGPTIISGSPGFDAPPSQWPAPELITDPALADDLVMKQKAAGWSFIKVYTGLSVPVYDAIVVAARAHDIPVSGHVPTAVDVRHALASGQRSIEHLTGYDRVVSATQRGGTWAWTDAQGDRYAGLADATAKAGTWNCPTLAIYAELSKQHSAADRAIIVRERRAFVLALEQAGAALLAGTDAGIDVVAPGSSLHDELEEFVAAGLSPARVLRMATLDAARFLGQPDGGRVAVGARADLVLLTGNPLTRIGETRNVEGIVLRGAWHSRAALEALP
ncbi:MAG: amidohydrolase family protein [Gemmatimonadaceae bacterium]